ncbi:MAG: carbohydrate kinase family protein [Clostridia bacterium]|nr:carbohydrate kinase family protein [Clostridia bacterium]
MKKILCIGSITVDIMIRPVNELPAPGTLVAVDSLSTHVGGCASNAAADLAKLGVPVVMSALVGDDMMGDFFKKTISSYGVDIKGVMTSKTVGTTVSTVLISEDGERSFLYNPASAAAFTDTDIPDELIQECDIVFIGGALLLTAFDGAPAARVMKRARELGKITVMDTAWDFADIWLPKIRETLPYLDYFIPSIEEAAKLTGEEDPEKIADKLHDLGSTHIAVKVGKRGAMISPVKGEYKYLPTYSGIKRVDTTGAGDSFCAGFLTGLANDWDMERSAQFGNAVASHCIQAIGASTAIPPMADVLKFMETHIPG